MRRELNNPLIASFSFRSNLSIASKGKGKCVMTTVSNLMKYPGYFPDFIC